MREQPQLLPDHAMIALLGLLKLLEVLLELLLVEETRCRRCG